MRAMIFAAGLGTRLKPFTLEHPKALAPVQGVPMLGRVIEKLILCGIDEMVVNVHHFAGQIIDYIRANDSFGIKIHISDESECLLDTGGGILKARHWLEGDDFIVHNADILTDFDLGEMTRCHTGAGSMATLLVAERDTSRYLLFDNGMAMRGWTNIKTGEVRPPMTDTSSLQPLAFGGVHILSPEVFAPLAKFAGDRQVFSIIDFYVDRCHDNLIKGYMPCEKYYWHDIGKPESLARANTQII